MGGLKHQEFEFGGVIHNWWGRGLRRLVRLTTRAAPHNICMSYASVLTWLVQFRSLFDSLPALLGWVGDRIHADRSPRHIKLEALAREEVSKDLPQMCLITLAFHSNPENECSQSKGSTPVESRRRADLGLIASFFRTNHLYFLIHSVSLKAIPWQRAVGETDEEDIAQGFESPSVE